MNKTTLNKTAFKITGRKISNFLGMYTIVYMLMSCNVQWCSRLGVCERLQKTEVMQQSACGVLKGSFIVVFMIPHPPHN